MATNPVFLPGKFYGQRSLVGYICGVEKGCKSSLLFCIFVGLLLLKIFLFYCFIEISGGSESRYVCSICHLYLKVSDVIGLKSLMMKNDIFIT